MKQDYDVELLQRQVGEALNRLDTIAEFGDEQAHQFIPILAAFYRRGDSVKVSRGISELAKQWAREKLRRPIEGWELALAIGSEEDPLATHGDRCRHREGCH